MPDAEADKAIDILLKGGLVAVPTETVYGLAADATNGEAIARIYQAKNRPEFNPLICHVSDIIMAEKLVKIPLVAKTLMKAFWPGPISFVLTQQENSPVNALVSAGLDTLAVRMPDHELTHELITKLNRPIAAPSANPSGRISPTSAKDVKEGLGNKVDLVLDGGDCSRGIESTIVTFDQDFIIILRPGSITKEMLEEVINSEVKIYNVADDASITAPGQLSSHYAPSANVRLNATNKNEGEVLIGFGNIQGDYTLSKNANLAEAASMLFKTMRAADKSNAKTIAIAPIPHEGIGIAINDRLERAAAPRK